MASLINAASFAAWAAFYSFLRSNLAFRLSSYFLIKSSILLASVIMIISSSPQSRMDGSIPSSSNLSSLSSGKLSKSIDSSLEDSLPSPLPERSLKLPRRARLFFYSSPTVKSLL